QKYLAEGMWHSEEFNARRWMLARAIERLGQYPAERQGIAPSVLVANTASQSAKDEMPFIEKAIQAGNLETKDLGGDFTSWSSGTKEGTVRVTEEAGYQGQKGLRWHVRVDHETDGGEGGNYPVGWPRISRTFVSGELDISRYDYLSFVVRVDSDLDEVADDSTPFGFYLTSHKATRQLFSMQKDLGDRQQMWIPIRFSIKDIMESAGLGSKPWTDIARVQFYISEGDFAHGTNLTFDIAEVKLLRFKSPVISQIIVPEYLPLPNTHLPISFDVMGTNSVKPGSHKVVASFTTTEGHPVAQQEQDLASQRVVVLDTSYIFPGRYQLHLRITDADGKLCSEGTRDVEAIPGSNFDSR
ncbi:MAG: hypothetical protein QG588_462, partial [Candidatus Poribacteria bacterium]|nr:hypothetical protein [Candidatus Poribacteria bacterium]